MPESSGNFLDGSRQFPEVSGRSPEGSGDLPENAKPLPETAKLCPEAGGWSLAAVDKILARAGTGDFAAAKALLQCTLKCTASTPAAARRQ